MLATQRVFLYNERMVNGDSDMNLVFKEIPSTNNQRLIQVFSDNIQIGIITDLGCNNVGDMRDWRVFVKHVNGHKQLNDGATVGTLKYLNEFKQFVQTKASCMMNTVNEKMYSIKVTFNSGFTYNVTDNEYGGTTTSNKLTLLDEITFNLLRKELNNGNFPNEPSFPTKVVCIKFYEHFLDENLVENINLIYLIEMG